MITFDIKNFLQGGAQDFALLLGQSYDRFRSNPGARYLSQWTYDEGVNLPGSTYFFQPQQNNGLADLANANDNLAFVGNTYFSFILESLPTTYTKLQVWIKSVEPLAGGIQPDMLIWEGNQGNSPVQTGVLYTIEIPTIPYNCIYFDPTATVGAFRLQFCSVGWHGLLITA